MVSCFYGSNCPGKYERDQRMKPFDLSTTSCEGKVFPALNFIVGTEMKVDMHGCSSILELLNLRANGEEVLPDNIKYNLKRPIYLFNILFPRLLYFRLLKIVEKFVCSFQLKFSIRFSHTFYFSGAVAVCKIRERCLAVNSTNFPGVDDLYSCVSSNTRNYREVESGKKENGGSTRGQHLRPL
ncbi:hypothetical protein PRIPAC_95576 [Pristionchus pacificus]|uniref:Uncharacterized protein n=1 Tax=Pristionchus pacificus TaxID=54126 RepID=A0A2A6D2N0_PRIPA|nr:hypothetical protein PRIPAC_95576 [Pristionchus pacificus]|eukprot:PDM84543.1 hypothetical protein PRIPAC_33566 [Pristionchus pacificus]